MRRRRPPTPPPEPEPEAVSDHDLLVRIDERTQALVVRREDHETRIRRLEVRQIVLSCAAAAAGIGGGGLIDKIIGG